MRVFNIDDQEITSPDLSLGRVVPEKRFVSHHPAVAAVEEVWHYEEIAVYPNGGKDFTKVVDVPGVEAVEAWDEYEDIMRYIPYTPEELAAIEANRKPTTEEQIAELREALDLILSGVTE